jgi:hypothetical protein
MDFTSKQLKKIDSLIAGKISKRCLLSEDDLCFCGSTKNRAICCLQSTNYWLTKKSLDRIIGFAKYRNFNVSKNTLPKTFLKELETDFQNKYSVCAMPNCDKPCIKSHVFGKALVKKYFNSDYCKWSVINDNGVKKWTQAGIDSEIGYQIFCSECDDNLFRDIDDVNHDLNNTQNQLLHILRTLAYQYQFNRTQLGLAHQIAFATIPMFLERNNHLSTETKEKTIDVSHLTRCYVRYCLTESYLKEMNRILKAEEFDNGSYWLISRKIKTRDSFFAQGIENPKIDVLGNKVVLKKDCGFIYCILPSNDNEVQLIAISFCDEYKVLLKQLNSSSEYKCRRFISKLIEKKNSPRGVLVKVDTKEHQKIFR